MKLATVLAVLLGLPSTALAEQLPIAMITERAITNGYLWTSSFQRVDGSTCVWIKVQDRSLTKVIYDKKGGSCRATPSNSPTATFDYSTTKGARLVFGGVDFDVTKNTKALLSGRWNHVSFDRRFAVDNVVFRALPD